MTQFVDISSLGTGEIVAGVVPHESEAPDFWDKVSSVQPDTVVIIDSGDNEDPFTTTSLGRFEDMEVDYRLRLKSDGVISVNRELDGFEYADMVKQALPEASVFPISLGANVSQDDLDVLVLHLDEIIPSSAIVIAKRELSPLAPQAAALKLVQDTAALYNFESEDASDELYIVSKFSELRDGQQIQETDQGYFYANGKYEEYVPNTTLYAVGDIMLGRFVETLMTRSSKRYPFQDMGGLISDVEIAFGNLEGPIHTDHRQTPDFDLHFSFDPIMAGLLSAEGFDIMGLANNHTYDQGIPAFLDTMRYLHEDGLEFFGHPMEARPEYVLKHGDINFIGFHDTFQGDFIEEDALAVITDTASADTFDIVSIHWGPEYALTSAEVQQELGHKIIDAGADLIIGHHPHVVQEIEEYEGKLIFYSLGNFIFDQYFSPDVQEGLTVGIEFTDDGVMYRLIPVIIDKSQPRPMAEAQAQDFYNKLADRTGPDLADEVRQGFILR